MSADHASHARRVAFLRGRRAERFAAAWLVCKGYRIVGRQVREGGGEIDILARRGGILAVVEVKMRTRLSDAEWERLLHPAQQARLLRATAMVVARRRDLQGLQVRFDLILVRPWLRMRHMRDVFTFEGEGSRVDF